MSVRVIVANSRLIAKIACEQIGLDPRRTVIVNTNDDGDRWRLQGLSLQPDEVALVYGRTFDWRDGRYSMDFEQELRMRGADPYDCGRIEV